MRATTDSVTAIYPTTADLNVFIEMANLLVDEELASSGLSERRLKLIESNLAAHFALLAAGGQIVFQAKGESRESYAGKYGEGLKSTRYGQAAISLDSTGSLSVLADANRKAILRVV